MSPGDDFAYCLGIANARGGACRSAYRMSVNVAAPLYLWRSRYGELSLDKYLRVELGPRRRFEMRAGEPQTNA